MAQINLTLNQEEILQLPSADRGEAFRVLLQNSLNSILKAESQEQLKAAPYERSEERTDSRNGSRDRELKTRVGKITLSVPRHQNQPFKTIIFDNYSRSEAALVATMAVKLKESSRQVKELQDFIAAQSAKITGFDEMLVRMLIRKITVYPDRFTIEFKSGVTVEIKG